MEAIEQENWRKGLVIMSGNDVKRKVSTPIVVGLVMLILGLLIGVGAGRFVNRGSVLAKKGQSAKGTAGPSTGDLVRRLCLGGQLWSHRPAVRERVEHFPDEFVITEEGPAFGRISTFEHKCDRRGVLKSPPAGGHSIEIKYLESYDDNECKS